MLVKYGVFLGFVSRLDIVLLIIFEMVVGVLVFLLSLVYMLVFCGNWVVDVVDVIDMGVLLLFLYVFSVVVVNVKISSRACFMG